MRILTEFSENSLESSPGNGREYSPFSTKVHVKNGEWRMVVNAENSQGMQRTFPENSQGMIREFSGSAGNY